MLNWIIIFGNPVDGLQFQGPFDDKYDAIDFAENFMSGGWSVAPLKPRGELN